MEGMGPTQAADTIQNIALSVLVFWMKGKE